MGNGISVMADMLINDIMGSSTFCKYAAMLEPIWDTSKEIFRKILLLVRLGSGSGMHNLIVLGDLRICSLLH